ncbi:hypothetical protein GWI33_010664 [Rhynchophorus ferrugineus]|uniref:DNA/RNA non-specific endonuclease/pyrophosphatase/phosphodiesterase domain-containing protein n=1 Tax=Rhynchophorus ferrugineus TaxID=354439 RepID=A0A834IWZ4_RHYFE|nr:hypothetical protein GWI33_010664 [Rhynchophorus ferrugineus]
MKLLILAIVFRLGTAAVVPGNNTVADVNAVDCEIVPFGTLPTPLLVSGTQFVYPLGTESTIKLAAGETIDFACPGGRLVTEGTQTTLQVATGTCVTGTRFIVNNARYLFHQLTCTVDPVSTIRYTGNSCELNGREIEIGFSITSSRFVRTMQVCFDQSTQSTIYSYFDMIPAINNQIRSTPRPSWLDGTGIYTISNVNSYYVRGTQRRNINSLLGLSATDTKYIQNNNYFLSRGHLTARSDYFYAALQNSTFYFVNALPQWQTFNGFNWDQAETDVQNYAEANNVNLRIWTGGYGIATLPHETTGNAVPLYLYVSGSTKAIPVPLLFWKVIYNPVTQRGVALIGVNNPYASLAEIDQFCDDVSDRLTWLNWRKDDQSRGYSWACTVTAFRRIVKSIPELTIRGLLF